ncbi:MAG: phosphoribosylaminoimidazolesuccinocarboxamide synthase [Flavobacteriales bacterium]|tara:strand:- start:6634 stop:7593 length:960 start_codon:yes stop_codon:yes gene_type:complete
MSNALMQTNLNIEGLKSKYTGKVREVYRLDNETLIMVATDRLSAFDVVMPRGVPFKGQILNQIATKMLEATSDIVPNWLVATPDPNVSVGVACDPFKVEMVIRGYLSGHAARTYKSGKRSLCGVSMPEGMIENDPFPIPIITPATKAEEGHDEDISKKEIIDQGIVSEFDYLKLEEYTQKLFARGTNIAKKQGLILVDTKYEFGKSITTGEILLIDEIHTPDSSRYFYEKGYAERQAQGMPQKQLSKEFVRQWLISNGFQGLEGQTLPEMDKSLINSISERYIELYENITGLTFEKASTSNLQKRINENVSSYMKSNNY